MDGFSDVLGGSFGLIKRGCLKVSEVKILDGFLDFMGRSFDPMDVLKLLWWKCWNGWREIKAESITSNRNRPD